MAGLVSSSSIEQIRAASDIVDVIGACLPLKRAGANFVALCPFHKEKTPSFNVNPHRQIFHCFGCHKGGDVFTFVKEYENISFIEAVRRLADRASIPLETDQTPGQQQARYLKETLWQIHEQITQHWHRALTNDAAAQVAREYLQRRGVSDDAVKLFRLGYAPDAWDDTVNWGKSRDFEPALMEKGGLVLRKEGTEHFYDRFRGRLIFPICDEQGRVIGFSGRLLAEDAKAAKYVNSPETPIFTKGKVIYGLDKTKRALLDAETAIICEGQLDLIACFMAGVQNVVAPQGTALTADHARILKRYVEEVVLCFDSDLAGQSAAVRSLDSLLAAGLAIRVAVVPAPHDPDSLIKQAGADAFRAIVNNAEGFFDFYLNRLCATNDITTDRGRLAVAREMSEAVQKTGNVVLMDTYAQKTALRLNVAPEAMRAEFKKVKRPQAPGLSDAEAEALSGEETEQQMPRPSAAEFWLLKLLLASDEHVDWTAAHLNLEWLQHPVVRSLVAARVEAHTRQAWQGVAGLLAQIEDDQTRSLITEAVAQDRPIENPERGLAEVIQRLRNQFLDREITRLKHRLGQPGISGAEQEELLRGQAQLRVLKQQPLATTRPEAPA